jgi:hypothetical protein
MTMIDDGVRQAGTDDRVQVKDVAELVLESLAEPGAGSGGHT